MNTGFEVCAGIAGGLIGLVAVALVFGYSTALVKIADLAKVKRFSTWIYLVGGSIVFIFLAVITVCLRNFHTVAFSAHDFRQYLLVFTIAVPGLVIASAFELYHIFQGRKNGLVSAIVWSLLIIMLDIAIIIPAWSYALAKVTPLHFKQDTLVWAENTLSLGVVLLIITLFFSAAVLSTLRSFDEEKEKETKKRSSTGPFDLP